MTNAKINPHDTTALLRDHGTDYLLVAAHSARVAMASLETARAKIALQVEPLRDRVRRVRNVSVAVAVVSSIVAGVAGGVLGWHSMVSSIVSDYEDPLWALLTAGVLGCVCCIASTRWADSAEGEIASLERRPVVELLGGVYVPEEEFLLPDGSLLINLRHRNDHLLAAAESLTGDQRSRIVALARCGSLGQAVEALDLIGQEERSRQTQAAVRGADGERPARRTPLLRIFGRRV